MRLPELRDRLDRECEFPAENERLRAALDDVRLDAPDGDPTELAAVLERANESTFGSLQELHSTVLANLGDRHVGRKHYDDRSRTHTRSKELSF